MKSNEFLNEDGEGGATGSSSIAAGPAQNLLAQPQKRVKENVVGGERPKENDRITAAYRNKHLGKNGEYKTIASGDSPGFKNELKKKLTGVSENSGSNPYEYGTWEFRNHELGQAGKNIRKSQVAQTIAKHELEGDEFFTADQKAKQITGRKTNEAVGDYVKKPLGDSPAGRVDRTKESNRKSERYYEKKAEAQKKKPVANEMSTDTIRSAKEKALQKIQPALRKGDTHNAAKHARFAHKAQKKLGEDQFTNTDPTTTEFNNSLDEAKTKKLPWGLVKDGKLVRTHMTRQQARVRAAAARTTLSAAPHSHNAKVGDKATPLYLDDNSGRYDESVQKTNRTKWIIESKDGELKMISAPATWTKEQVQESTECKRIVEAPMKGRVIQPSNPNHPKHADWKAEQSAKKASLKQPRLAANWKGPKTKPWVSKQSEIAPVDSRPVSPLEAKAKRVMQQVWQAIAPDAQEFLGDNPGADEVAELCTDANRMQTFANLTRDEELEILSLGSKTLERLANDMGY